MPATKSFLTALLLLAAAHAGEETRAAVQGGASNQPAAATRQPAAAPPLRVEVDPRAELLSLIFRLAGNPEYNRAKLAGYAEDVDRQFSPFRDHKLVQLASELRGTRGVSYDAVMGMAVHLSDASKPHLRVALTPWPESLDQRWTTSSASNFVRLTGEFIRESNFGEFIRAHHSLYATTTARLKALLDREGHLEWFNAYFGRRPQAAFTAVPGLLNGGNCYGVHFTDAAGREELYCILGVWRTDTEGLPEFTTDMLDTVVHEFCHSYANPLIDRHDAELRTAGEKLFTQVAERMRAQAYGHASTMLRESLVRACAVRYVRQFKGAAAARRAIQNEKSRGFLWMQELTDLLGEYEAQRDSYRSLEDFAPRLVSFFREYAKHSSKHQEALAGKPPAVVWMTPTNGATTVAPGLTEMRVVFDRPMQALSWSLCGGGPHFPETAGQPRYDSHRTTWTVPVKLKPDWDYEFGLNCTSYNSFRSEEGVPLEPVLVTFRTANK